MLNASRALEDSIENYAMLSRLFRVEVDAGLLEDLMESPVVGATGNDAFDEGYATMRRFLDSVTDIARGKTALAIDYSLAFLGYGANPDGADGSKAHAAYPYESFYRTGSKSLGGEHCVDVSNIYRAHAFMPTKTRLIAEDHIACEFEFLQYLANVEAEAVRSGDEQQAILARRDSLDFIESHLLTWIGALRQEVEKRVETPFYTGLCDMAQGWLEIDAESLRSALADGGEGDAR